VKTIAVAFYETPWFQAILIVLIAVIAARIVDALLARRDSTMTRLLGKAPDSAGRTRFVMVRRLAQASILFVGVAFALSKFAVVANLAQAMLASVAIFAAVIGIAARAPLANLVSGVMIAFSQPVRLGDYISVDDVYGTVEEISLTYTFIRTHDNRRVVIPNEAFASRAVSNYSMGSPGSVVEVSLAVPLTADLDRVRAAALEVADRLAPAPEGSGNSVEVRGLGLGEVTLVVSAWADEAMERRRLASDLRAAIFARIVRDDLLGRASGTEGQAAEDRPG